jgi:membrane protease YdiL (CAAX protease family)
MERPRSPVQPAPGLGEQPLMSGGPPAEGSLPARPPAAAGSPDPALAPWTPWMAPLALVAGLVLAAVGAFAVDLPAVALGVRITASHTPPGVAVADTFVQDLAFIVAAVFCAQLGGRTVHAWQFGLRPPRVGWRRAAGMILVLIVAFLLLNVLWALLVNPGKEKILEQLGSNENAALLLLSAALTCIVAPISEEFLFRGFIFTALRNWRGTIPAAVITGLLFGGVHAGSAPLLDLVPLAALGFGLCLLYRYTESLYPGIVAHALNNSIAFASLEGWGWEAAVLIAGSLAGIAGLVIALKRLGVITPEAMPVGPTP